MKKPLKLLTAVLLLASILGAMTGCNTDDNPSDPEDPSGTTEQTQTTYSNPVYAPVFADPSVIRGEDGAWYAYATEDMGEWRVDDDPLNNVSMSKCVPILKSYDLVNWYYVDSAFRGTTKPSWGTIGANVWAPDVVKIGDKYVMYYALSLWGDEDPGIGIATADSPEGPWEDQGKLFLSSEIGVDNSIDPAVFVGEDGNVYMIWGSFRGIFGIELTSDGLSVKGGVEYAAENKTLVAGIVGAWNGATYEAPYVIYKDGYYYMFLSSGTCCDGHNSTYHVRVGRSTSPLGPYVDDNGDSMCAESKGHVVVAGSNEFVGVGHNCITIDDAGNYYILYHAYDTSESENYATTNRRSLMIDKLVWTDDGWPEVEGQVAGTSGMAVPVINS